MKRVQIGALAFACMAIASCLPRPMTARERTTESERYRERLTAESLFLAQTPDTTYRRRMQDFIRRSLMVPTDSLARLYVALKTAPEDQRWQVRHDFRCEIYYLMRAYGVASYQRADKRLQDSLSRTGFDVEETFNRMSVIKGSDPQDVRGCDERTRRLPTLPDSIRYEPSPAGSPMLTVAP